MNEWLAATRSCGPYVLGSQMKVVFVCNVEQLRLSGETN